MLVKNYELKFSFEVNDDFSEIKSTSYEAFNVAPNTIHYFVKLDDEGNVGRVLSLCKDKKCTNEEEVLAVVKRNVEQMKKFGFDLIFENDFETHKNRKIYRRVFIDEEQEHAFVTYFTLIKGVLIASTTEITEFYDEYEEEMYEIFATIEEF